MRKENIDSNYEVIDRAFSMQKANQYGLASVPLGLLMLLGYYSYIGGFNIHEFSLIGMFPVFIVGIILHELIHGFFWAIHCEKGFKSIKFGLDKKTLNPYAHCKEILKVKPYVIGAIMPGILTGLVPYIIAFIIKNENLAIAGTLLLVSAFGDWMIIYTLRNEKADSFVEDHPTDAGCKVYVKK